MMHQNNNHNNNGHHEDKFKVEETLKLRESLIQAFKQQIKLRKNVLDLDNALMDINIEAERHNKLIEKYNRAFFFALKNSFTLRKSLKIVFILNSFNPRDPANDADTVRNAREELKVVEQDRDDLDKKRAQSLKELEIVRAKTRKLRDQASKKLTNAEQKEILTLLLKNFEYEIKNIEIQAELFKRDFKLREQDMVILRLEQHRSLCDTLIVQQRKLILDNNLQLPQDLDELYNLYARDVNEGQLIKDLSSLRSNSNVSINSVNNNNNNNGGSPKPKDGHTVNTFLTQIQEENGSITPMPENKNKTANTNNKNK
jgi:kinesin family protein 18/19